jgi:hypothetical protein
VKHGEVKQVVQKYQAAGCEFTTRETVCYKLALMITTKEKSFIKRIILLDSQDSDGHQPRNKGRRPKGVTANTKQEYSDKLKDLTTNAADMEMYFGEQQKVKHNKTNVPNGTLNAVIK